MYGLVRAGEGPGSRVAELAIAPLEDSQDGKLIRLNGFTRLPGFDPHPCAVWAQDGRWVALAATNEVWVVDTETQTIRKLPGFRPSDLEWRPGTDELAIAGDQGANRDAPRTSTPITIYSVSTGRFREIDTVDAAHVSWSPDGATLAYVGGEDQVPQLGTIDADGGGQRVLRSAIGNASHGIGPVWSPTGERIAYQRLILGTSGERHEVVLVDAVDGSETVIGPPEVGGRTWYPYSVAWSPDGETLVYVAWSGSDTARALLAVPVDDPGSATVLDDDQVALSDTYSSGWTLVQMWGRQS